MDIDGWEDSDEDHGGIAKCPALRRTVTAVGPKTWEVAIPLTSEVEINGFQLTLSVPDGLELVEYSTGAYGELTPRKAETHRLYNGSPSVVGKMTFMSYSDNNDLFASGNGDIMKFRFKAVGDSVPANCDVTVSSVEMSDKECKAIRPSDFVLSGATIVENERAYAFLSAQISVAQAKLDSAKATIAKECADVLASYEERASVLQGVIDSLEADLKSKYESVSLAETSTLDLTDLEAAIEKMVSDAIEAQRVAGMGEVSVSQRQATVDVYSINGTKVRASVPVDEATEGLRTGVYIINKKKALVR